MLWLGFNFTKDIYPKDNYIEYLLNIIPLNMLLIILVTKIGLRIRKVSIDFWVNECATVEKKAITGKQEIDGYIIFRI